MNGEPAWRRYLRLGGPSVPRDIDDEFLFHVETRAAELRTAGHSADDAHARAVAEFGDAASARRLCIEIGDREHRRRRRAEALHSLVQDVRFASRMLARAPGFALVAICTLALGIGATTAIFSVVHAVLLRSLPYADAGQLVSIWNNYGGGLEHAAVSPPEFADILERGRAFAAVGAAGRERLNLTGDGEPERVIGYSVSPDLLGLLGIAPTRGRGFTDADGAAGSEPVVVLAHTLWQRRFGGAPDILGRTIQLNGTSRTVVGVLPPEARFPEAPLGFLAERGEVFLPYDWRRSRSVARGNQYLGVIARLQSGQSLRDGQADLDAIAAQFKAEYPSRYADVHRWRLLAVPVRDLMVSGVRPTLLISLGAIALVLLIVCVNLANLMLARGTVRQRELAIRTSLGAGRWRIVRQLLTESLLIAFAGGALGVGVAWLGVRGLIVLDPGNIPRLDATRIDGTLLLFSLAVSLGAGIIFGLAPALRQSRPDVHHILKAGGGRGDSARLGRRVRDALVIVQVGMAIVVLVGAGLVLRSFVGLQRTDTGMNPGGALTFEVTLPGTSYPVPALAAFHRRLAEQLRALPGVTHVSAVHPLPLSEDRWSGSFDVAGRARTDAMPQPHAEYAVAMPGYFAAMGISLEAGRDFADSDDSTGAEVAIVDESLERAHWPGESALGKHLDLRGDPERLTTIVGVVAHTRTGGPRHAGEPQIYLPFLQRPQRPLYYVMRGGSPTSLAPAAREAVRALDPSLPVAKLRPMDVLVSRASARERFSVMSLTAFAATALLLASVGLYGVLSYVVSRRSREIAVRLALGATPSSVRWLVVGQGVGVALAGIALGLGAAAGLSRFASTLLFEVEPVDPPTYAAVAALVTAVSVGACWLPARRASRVDPAETLRTD